MKSKNKNTKYKLNHIKALLLYAEKNGDIIICKYCNKPVYRILNTFSIDKMSPEFIQDILNGFISQNVLSKPNIVHARCDYTYPSSPAREGDPIVYTVLPFLFLIGYYLCLKS